MTKEKNKANLTGSNAELPSCSDTSEIQDTTAEKYTQNTQRS